MFTLIQEDKIGTANAWAYKENIIKNIYIHKEIYRHYYTSSALISNNKFVFV